jgi:POT family proton-dependent oligopeptide transporter
MSCRAALSADPLLVWNYGVMAVLAFCGGVGFWFSFRHLDQEEETLNNLQGGHFDEPEK